MTTNRLSKSGGGSVTKCTFRAAEYAKIAEANGDHEKAKLWWKADRDGWDDEHYDHVLALEKRKSLRA